MNDNATEPASIVDNLYASLEMLNSTDNDLIPASERVKIAFASAVLMIVIHRLCGDTPEQIDAHLK